MAPRRRLAGSIAVALVATAIVLPGTVAAARPAARTPARPSTPGVVQPTPPITASAFAFEKAGSTPADGDGLIPVPATPTGSPPGRPSTCDETFTSSSGATAATVDASIARIENQLTQPYVICLAGTFTGPIEVLDKYSPAILEIADAPGRTALVAPGAVVPDEVDQNVYDGGDMGAVTIADSRGVEIYGLDISGYTSRGPDYAPAGILVTVRQSGSSNPAATPHESPCFLEGDKACGDIYLIDDAISDIDNTADSEAGVTASYCNNGDVGAFGIAVLSFGDDTAHALQHVVIEDDTVDHLRTGESESVTVNGDVTDFLEADNTVYDNDNIGVDVIGWEEGTDQARDGYIVGNLVANIDTWGNASYGQWSHDRCVEQPENAAGIYVDGASHVWIDDNRVWNTDQGIDLDVETPGRYADHLLVTRNTVVDVGGTSLTDPSTGQDPHGLPGGGSTVAGHDYDALYVDAYGKGASITDVYVHDNAFENRSQHYGATSVQVAPVVDIDGRWSDVMLWNNEVLGAGTADALNPLLEVDTQPLAGTVAAIDCTSYENPSSRPAGNFILPDGDSFVGLAGWQSGNGHGWDAHSAVGRADCPPSIS